MAAVGQPMLRRARLAPGFGALLLACSTTDLDQYASGHPAGTGGNSADASAEATAGSGGSAVADATWSCGVDEKDCNGKCVPLDDPATGCDEVTCAGCSLPHATAACGPSCVVGTCEPGRMDCDSLAANGCETDTESDPFHCGSCGHACGTSAVCSQGACKATCGSGLTICGGACVDLQTHGENCGSCGASCLGGACEAGKCAPMALAKNEISPTSVALSSTHVYWGNFTSNGQIRARALDLTTPVETLATSLSAPLGLSVHDGYLYWYESNRIQRIQLPKGQPELLVAGNITSMVVDDLIYYGGASGYLYRLALDGSTKVPIVQNSAGGPIQAVAAGSTHVFWQQGSAVYRMPKTGGTPQAIADASMPTGAALAVGNEYYYGVLSQVWLWDGSTKLLASDQQGPFGFAHDGQALFWVNRANPGNLRRLPTPYSLGSTQTLATDLDQPGGVASDASAVYWTNSGSGEVLRLAKGK